MGLKHRGRQARAKSKIHGNHGEIHHSGDDRQFIQGEELRAFYIFKTLYITNAILGMEKRMLDHLVGIF